MTRDAVNVLSKISFTPGWLKKQKQANALTNTIVTKFVGYLLGKSTAFCSVFSTFSNPGGTLGDDFFSLEPIKKITFG